ncbi:MAG: alpha-(1-_3)-arabinofuranosyltransferase family protein, partial [Solirubrobacteraceae bacterium]
VRLLDVLLGSERGPAHALAAVLYAVNPLVVVYISRASGTLLALAVLPWLMLAVVRGVREPRSWQWPVLIGLMAALSGGGINAAQVAWIALAPVALLIWEATVGRAGRSAAFQFGLRAAVCAFAGAAWWLIPAILQGSYGADFLRFTELPQTIWATTSASESLRLLGYWPMYLGTGYGAAAPVMQVGQSYLFDPLVIIGTFVVPVAALLGLRSTSRWFYAPFFALLACASVTIMAAGFPQGTALRHLLTAAYNHLQVTQFLRTSYKAAPMLALSLAILAGLWARDLVSRLKRPRSLGRQAVVPGLGLLLLGLSALVWALPLFTGRAIDRPLAYNRVPPAWPEALRASARAGGANARTLVLPGELYGYYVWGRTWDSIAPALARSPVTIRQASRYADPRSAELLDMLDDQVQQGRLVPGELAPLLRLLGVGQVLTASDALDSQSGGSGPADVAQSLSNQPGFSAPVATYGPSHTFAPAPGRDGPVWRVPEIRRYRSPRPAGLVHLDTAGPATILDGGPGGIIELAADGRLAAGNPLFYAADLSRRQLAALVQSGARLVFSDSNRRQVVARSYTTQDVGPTLTASAPIPAGASFWDLFPEAGPRAQTVASYSGLADLVAPQPFGAQLFPAFAPYAALDGRLGTSWMPDTALPPSQLWMQLRLDSPRQIGAITLVPKLAPGISPLRVGISVNGGPERDVALHSGPNRLNVNASGVRTLRFRLLDEVISDLPLGSGGLEEIGIPGVTPIRRTLVLPTLLTSALGGMNLSRSSLELALTRTTSDFPTLVGSQQGEPLGQLEKGSDAESGISRLVTLPSGRRFSVSGWATVSPSASDATLDALTGSAPGWVMTSSSRFDGLPSSRASAAFDGRPSTAWVGNLISHPTSQSGQSTWQGALDLPYPWLAIRGPRMVELSTLRLVPGPARYSSPAVVQLITDAGPTGPLRVGSDGLVRLPSPVRTRSLLVRIRAVHPATGLAGARLLSAVAVSDVVSPFKPPSPRRHGPLNTACGALTLVGPSGTVALRVFGTVQQLDRNTPLRLAGCGPSSAVALPGGQSQITVPPGAVFRPDHLLLDSAAPVPLVSPRPPAIARLEGPLPANDIPASATLPASGRGWLVLGESFSRGWRASCGGDAGGERSLGPPVPIDGYANGWALVSPCRHVSFRFAPQRTADIAYLVSLISIPIGLALVLLSRRRRSVPTPRLQRDHAPDRVVQLGWFDSIVVGAVATIVLGFLFAIPLGPLAVPILRRGTTPRWLFSVGGALLLAVPIAYLNSLPANPGGYDFHYAYDNLVGHWLAVGGICAIAAGSLLQLASRNHQSR